MTTLSTPIDDINDAPSPVPDAYAQELGMHVVTYAEQWSMERPFYAQRSHVDPLLLVVGTSIGTDQRTRVKTNVNGTIEPAKNLQSLVDHHVVMRDGAPLVEVYDYLGRHYVVRYLRIIDGKAVKLWITRYEPANTCRPWTQFRRRGIRLSQSARTGYQIEL